MTVRRLLIANRGEIALRVIRAARGLGVETVLAASEADRDSLPARFADRVVCIGPGPASESYLNANAVVQAALGVEADAIHPGYGFLSERVVLAELCEREDVVFIGPTSQQIAAVGDKMRARAEAVAAGVPVAPGGPVDTPEEALALAREIGPPLLIKAVGGGGGRGMKRVDDLAQVPAALELASAEAGAAFGDARVYLERFVAHGRHVEVQLLGDGERVIHLGDRDCSVQRRYQKLIEEAPAPGLPEKLRTAIRESAVRFGARLGYRSAGTVEFLVDLERQAFYFLEMNARIQVEHPVTEAVTGVDLVGWQIRIAGGERLSLAQSDVRFGGSAIEARINAEDPVRDFHPAPGRVGEAVWPGGEGVRVDTHIASGSFAPPFYDSLLGKIIASGPDRATALARLRSALAETRLSGVATNLSFQADILADPAFAAGGVDTGFLPRFLERRAGAQGRD
jgi:acetyl-CoA carboxylase biotin carboxylase subunit